MENEAEPAFEEQTSSSRRNVQLLPLRTTEEVQPFHISSAVEDKVSFKLVYLKV